MRQLWTIPFVLEALPGEDGKQRFLTLDDIDTDAMHDAAYDAFKPLGWQVRDIGTPKEKLLP